VVLASWSCSFQLFGTLRLNAIMRLSASILRSSANRGSPLAVLVFCRSAVSRRGPDSARIETELVLSNWL
jgi:hypothetical protein